MADFKSVISRLKDNDETAMYINELRGFNSRKNHDEITTRVEKGWGNKLFSNKAVLFTVLIEREEFDRICKEIDEEN